MRPRVAMIALTGDPRGGDEPYLDGQRSRRGRGDRAVGRRWASS